MNGYKIAAAARRWPWISWTACLTMAYALKIGYSRADAEGLGWILEPTAQVVGALRGERLALYSEGWAPADRSYVIAPACAGVNFLILAFVVSVLGFSHRVRTARGRSGFFLGALAGAWMATLLVNGVRILGSIELYRLGSIWGVTAGQLHRLLGVVIYLGALLGLFGILDRWTVRSAPGDPARKPAAAVPWLVPAAYLGMTLGVPILTGAYAQRGPLFAEHAIMVLGATIGALGVALVVWRWIDRIEGRP